MGALERLNPPRVLGDMTLLAKLGQGGMASVYLAAVGRQSLSRLVAVKLLRADLPDHDYRTRFLDEARVVIRLHHNNLVNVRSAGEIAGQLYIAMEAIEGRDLSDIWDKCADVGRAFPVPLAVYVVREVLRGLHYAHNFPGLSLVHRDVSPSNILIDWAGAVRLADFGLATSTLKDSLTMPGIVFGKVGYMSPEQAKNQPLDRRADVYTCGAVLWELLTGRPLRPTEGLNADFVARFQAVPPSEYSRRVDEDLDRIVVQALMHDKDRRWESAETMLSALNRWLAEKSPETGQEQLASFLSQLFGNASEQEHLERDQLLHSINSSNEDSEVSAYDRVAGMRASAVSHSSGKIGAIRPVSNSRTRIYRKSQSAFPSGSKENEGALSLAKSPPGQQSDPAGNLRSVQSGDQEYQPGGSASPFPELYDPMRNELIADGTIIDDRYRVVSRIGKGGMGTVYLAEHITVGRSVAIKVLTHEWSANHAVAQRFREEARAASMAGHPNIVEVFDAGTLPDGRLFLVMEFLTGRNLFEELRGGKTIEPGRACRIIRDVIRAIRAAHDVRIIHRDLKPDNVMLVDRGEGEGETVKVLDFGISASTERSESEQRLTIPGHAIGTPEYMAPEQARGHEPTQSFDIYAIGVIFYEMLVGAPPFSGTNYVEVMARKTTEKPISIADHRPDLPAELSAAIDDCLKIDPKQRPKSAGELLSRIEKVMLGVPNASSDKSQSAVIRPRTHDDLAAAGVNQPRRFPIRWVGVALACGLVVMLAIDLANKPKAQNSNGFVQAGSLPSKNSRSSNPSDATKNEFEPGKSKQSGTSGTKERSLANDRFNAKKHHLLNNHHPESDASRKQEERAEESKVVSNRRGEAKASQNPRKTDKSQVKKKPTSSSNSGKKGSTSKGKQRNANVDCSLAEKRLSEVKARRQWPEILRQLDLLRKRCWSNKVARQNREFLVEALFENQQWERCLAAGKRSKNNRVKGLLKICEARAKKAKEIVKEADQEKIEENED